MATDQFVQQRAHGIDIIGHRYRATRVALGTQCVRRACRAGRVADALCAAEVREARKAVSIEQYVGALDVAVGPSGRVQALQGIDDGQQAAHDERPRSAAQAADLTPGQEFEHVVRLCALVDALQRQQHGRMRQSDERLLQRELLGIARGLDALEHDLVAGNTVAREPGLECFVLAAGAQRTQQLIARSDDLPVRELEGHRAVSLRPAGWRGWGVRRRGRRQPGLVLIQFAEQPTPFGVLLLGRTLQLQRATFDVDDDGLHFVLERTAELLQRLAVHLDLGAHVEPALERVDAADHRRRRRRRARAAAGFRPAIMPPTTATAPST